MAADRESQEKSLGKEENGNSIKKVMSSKT